MRQKFSSPRSVASRVNLTELRAELSVQPPTFISLSDLAPQTPSFSPHTSIHISNGSLPNGVIADRSQGELYNNKFM